MIMAHSALLGGLFWFVGGMALLGYLRKTIVESLLQTVTALEKKLSLTQEQLAEAKEAIDEMRADLSRVKAEKHLTNRQLGVALQIIEHFEHVVTVYIKSRNKIPAQVVAQIDEELAQLARYRERATLELESLEVNQGHYDWLLARAALAGPGTGYMTPCVESENEVS